MAFKSIELSAELISQLHSLAIPFVEVTPQAVIERLVNEALASKSVVGVEDARSTAIRQFSASSPPDLRHTHVLEVVLAGKPLAPDQANWNGLLRASAELAAQSVKAHSELRDLITVRHEEGEVEDGKRRGYYYLSSVNLSVQGREADGAWRMARHVAQRLGHTLKVTFEWPHKDGSAHPGVIGQFIVGAEERQ